MLFMKQNKQLNRSILDTWGGAQATYFPSDYAPGALIMISYEIKKKKWVSNYLWNPPDYI